MSFNYRLVLKAYEPHFNGTKEYWVDFHEVHYNDKKEITGWTHKPVSFSLSKMDDLEWLIEKIQELKDFDNKPVLKIVTEDGKEKMVPVTIEDLAKLEDQWKADDDGKAEKD